VLFIIIVISYLVLFFWIFSSTYWHIPQLFYRNSCWDHSQPFCCFSICPAVAVYYRYSIYPLFLLHYMPKLPILLYTRYKSSGYTSLKRANNRQYWTTATRIYYKSIYTSYLLLKQSELNNCLLETLLYRHYTRKQRKYYRTTKSS
jgi:hypothetical protein